MTITVSVPDALAWQVEAEGLSVKAYVERLAEQAAENKKAPQEVWRSPDGRTVQEVVAEPWHFSTWPVILALAQQHRL